MDAIKLRHYAELLETEIQANRGKSKDVDWLAQYRTLLEALEDARTGRIDQPRELGLNRWLFESNIQEFDMLTERLAQFEILLRGSELPSEGGAG
ncbi:hypothetical protein [Pararobbsia alpina]|uniref:Uncharacterized protein n=1 Tax=Pararobbsia alpina TaxID=621374 RepID=A0A6S7AVT7_9BURK|nr:hypothetical protein [Pararobbsia alpina]CAB3779458.1 hypothetical protein LMG28138_00820 [Pararobbsia alpina]